MGATNCPETPRQKMISMMYLVLTAMLALNVSVEILSGYSLVDGSLRRSIKIADARNVSLKAEFEDLAGQNPTKTKEWKEKADSVVIKSDEFYQYVTEIKRNIISLVDGSSADLENLNISENGRGDLNISGQIGFFKHTVDGVSYEPAGKELRRRMEDFSNFLQSMVTDSAKKATIASSFAIEDRMREGELIKWETTVFDGMPAVATLTLMSKIQNDIRNAEAEVVQYLIGQIDAGDFRVNKIEALVIPRSQYVIRGGKYHAQIVLAATDSTKPLEIEVGGRAIENGIYEVAASSVNKHQFKGSIKMKKPDGTTVEYPFNSEYVVGEPSATISADMMNVFYAGIDNPLSVSVPGVSASDVSISITNGTQVKTAKGWNIRPAKVGVESVIRVTAIFDGRAQVVAEKAFRVKPLPPPLAKIEITNAQGIKEKYKGGTPIAKNLLTTARRIVAELDDDDLDVKYKVLSFSLNSFDSMGNTLVETATGPELTQRQLAVFSKLTKGKTVYVSNVQAIGPDNVRRTLPPVEVSIR